jgi:segregation and condensation protein B
LDEKKDEQIARIEAALYAAGRPLDAEQLARAAGITSVRRAVSIARDIAERVKLNFRAIEVVEYPGQKFAMQLKPEFTQLARKFATRPLLSKGALRTLSYIAYFQPVKASDLVLKRSTSVYSHLKELEGIGFIVGERQGRTKVYRTTERFAEYFGLSTDLQAMKKQLEERRMSLR